ncbi:MAG: hypothetical protein FJ297_17450 [Planctomycetes bacterium]|nr:hypothetical protein [Planctomycetota bacterium]
MYAVEELEIRRHLGRRCRDTFASLKKTCGKLAVSFRDYLQDRIFGTGKITRLSELHFRQNAYTETVADRPVPRRN